MAMCRPGTRVHHIRLCYSTTLLHMMSLFSFLPAHRWRTLFDHNITSRRIICRGWVSLSLSLGVCVYHIFVSTFVCPMSTGTSVYDADIIFPISSSVLWSIWIVCCWAHCGTCLRPLFTFQPPPSPPLCSIRTHLITSPVCTCRAAHNNQLPIPNI